MADKNSKLKVVDEDGMTYCFADDEDEAVQEVKRLRDDAVSRLNRAKHELDEAQEELDFIDRFRIKDNK